MKNIRFLIWVLVISTLVLSACGTAAATSTVGGGKAEAMPVAFIGIVESITGDQWVISGTTMTVNPEVVRDGPFGVGDQVKVEGIVNSDGSFTVSRVEVPAPQDIATLTTPFGNDNSNEANANDNGVNANSNDDNSNDANTNDDNSNDANFNDDNSNDANGNDDNSNDMNTNDDNGGGSNGNDDNSSGSGGNDDNSGSGSGNSGKGGGGGSDDSGGGGDSGGNSNDD